MKSRLAIIALCVGAAGVLSGCGRLGDLERPGPMGEANRKAAEDLARREGSAEANRPARPNTTAEVRDPARSTATIRQQPIRGSNPDPFGGPSSPGMPNSGPQ